MSTIATSSIEQPTRQPLTWGSLLAQSYGLHRKRFWRLFRIALLPALLAYMWRYIYRLVVHQMAVAGWIGFESGVASFLLPLLPLF